MIRDYSQSSDLRYVILRYFNVAGADLQGRIGQRGAKASHLIKVACDAALGRRSSVNVFGTDFPTPDGTGIRDFIHVEDLAAAHLDALRYLETGQESQVLNCGYGQGYSVRQVLERMQEISGETFPIVYGRRRDGDLACADRIRRVLGWQPRYNDLDTILTIALTWERTLAGMTEAALSSSIEIGIPTLAVS